IADIDDILAVGRKIDFSENTSTSTERKSCNVCKLCARLRAEAPPRRSCVGLSYCLYGNGPCGNHVLLDKGGRYLKCAGNIVETFRGVVGRQHCIRIEFDSQEIPNRIGVFLAIETVKHELIRNMLR